MRMDFSSASPVCRQHRTAVCNLALANILAILAVLAWSPAAAGPSPAPGKLAPSLARLAAERPDERVVAWVSFTDRAGAERNPAARASLRPLVSARSLERRLRRGTITGLVASDLPVHEAYVRALVSRGARLRGTSRWLNAASVELPARAYAELSHLPFVAHMEIVPSAPRMVPVDELPAHADDAAESRAAEPSSAAPSATATLAPGDTAYYGPTFKQLAMMQVPQLHAMGLSGAGVLVCMLDSGFRTTHNAYASLDVLARRDFIHGDTNVDDQAGQDVSGQGSHGTQTLGCVAASQPGHYSGSAFGATVALGKTEDIETERPVEMDYWQFGAEWADSLGADVISSSLGYSTFDIGFVSYGPAAMDGRTTVVARAAVEAARRGITVVNSAGNGGPSAQTLVSPGDADSIITVGAVDSTNVVASFSSRGPTADGRIKPDVVARGRSVWVPSFTNGSAYTTSGGTSFSCPLTAGVVALLLESHPNWGPFEVREALRETALNHASPNSTIGWGLVQAVAANNWLPSTLATPARNPVTALALALGPNPLRAGTSLAIRFAVPAGSHATIEVLDLAGRRHATVYSGTGEGARTSRWDGRDARGGPLPAGLYWVRLAVSGSRGIESRAMRVVLLP